MRYQWSKLIIVRAAHNKSAQWSDQVKPLDTNKQIRYLIIMISRQQHKNFLAATGGSLQKVIIWPEKW